MRSLHCHRFGSCTAVCGVLLLLGACKDPVLDGVEVDSQGDDGGESIALAINHDVDILFVVDDTSSMDAEQTKLAAAMGALVEVLERAEVGANYRIAFTTTDAGNPACGGPNPAVGALRVDSCGSRLADFGDGQACSPSCVEEWADFETTPTVRDGDATPRPRPWIESTEGRTNLPEGLSVTQALQCASPQGQGGCAFEAPLESMWQALERTSTEGDAAYGFVRPSAVLSVVHVTDGTECSVNPEWEAIFLPEGDRAFWSDPEAEAPTAAVCWNAGVLCEGTSPYERCRAVSVDIDGREVSGRDAEELGVLHPPDRYIDRLQQLENDKQTLTPDQQVLVAIVAGVGADGSVAYADAVDPQLQVDFGIGPGCEGADGPAVPPVRLRSLADAFRVGDEPNVFSACDDDYTGALAAIGEAIVAQIRPACVPGCVADLEPSTEALDPSCAVVQESPRGDGSFDEIHLLECEPDRTVPAGQDACYIERAGDERSELCRDYGFNLELEFVNREGVPFPPGTSIITDCNWSKDRAVDCPDLP